MKRFKTKGMYDSSQNAKDACGIAGVASQAGSPSREVVEKAIELSSCMKHRSGYTAGVAKGSQEEGDGAGILLSLPCDFFKACCEIAMESSIAVGMFFFPKDMAYLENFKRLTERALKQFVNYDRIIWRDVPVQVEKVGKHALRKMPNIVQVVLVNPLPKEGDNLELALLAAKKALERSVSDLISDLDGETLKSQFRDEFFVCSLSSKSIVYKGMLTGEQLAAFYPDLNSPDFVAKWAMVHTRFATNTTSRWALAQPFSTVCHNGEINTLGAQISFMRNLENELGKVNPSAWSKLFPLIDRSLSDSGIMDNILEVLPEISGLLLPELVAVLLPYAWQKDDEVNPMVKEFYRRWSTIMPVCNGPAAFCFGKDSTFGAALDTNGFRPLYYQLVRGDNMDTLLVIGSEQNILGFSEDEILVSERLGPGEMIVLNQDDAGLMTGTQVIEAAAGKDIRPDAKIVGVDDRQSSVIESGDSASILYRLAARYGWGEDEIASFLIPYCITGKGATSSMGNDAMLPPFRVDGSAPLSHFLLQRFAQVTNPPVDYIRENEVTSLEVAVVSSDAPWIPEESRDVVVLESPLLSSTMISQLVCSYQSLMLSLIYTEGQLSDAIDALEEKLHQQDFSKYQLVVLSNDGPETDSKYIPSILGISIVNRYLESRGMRSRLPIIVDSNEVYCSHDLAAMLSFGATAVCPSMSHLLIEHLLLETPAMLNSISFEKAYENYRSSMKYELLKIMSRFGIHHLGSYIGARTFEPLGLSSEVCEFLGIPQSPLGGKTLEQIQDIYQVFGSKDAGGLPIYGRYISQRSGVNRDFNVHAVARIQGGEIQPVEQRITIKDFLRVKAELEEVGDNGIPMAELRKIFQRIRTSPMSVGALSIKAHELLALAADVLGFRSAGGEGGEDRRRLTTEFCSRIKQIASGRFGVHLDYLRNCDQIEIKIAQGAKPGEGGQLSWKKVTAEIAVFRGTLPHVALTSPPPHHDIYSIEDLAQLIYDLKSVNPKAQVCVKLVSSVGVGTIAIGVAKAGADVIWIAGGSGGTGNAPTVSINFTGLPWEIGLSEAHQALITAGIRDQVVLGTDGGLKSGRDMVVATMLGAEAFGIGTAALIAMGCVKANVCHTGACPVGVATTVPEFAQHFNGSLVKVCEYFIRMATEVSGYLRALDVDSLKDIVGQTEYLEIDDCPMDLNPLLYKPKEWRSAVTNVYEHRNTLRPVKNKSDNFVLRLLEKQLNDCKGAVYVNVDKALTTCDLSFGAYLASSMRDDPRVRKLGICRIDLHGQAGQSFGAWMSEPFILCLDGTANDGVGKGLSGATIIVNANPDAPAVGNVGFMGANSGYGFIKGQAGERFGILNKGAHLVVEGSGWHFCEYMLGGLVVSLGSVGRNAFAGMSGGKAFVFATEEEFKGNCNLDSVSVELVQADDEDLRIVRSLLGNHLKFTGSKRAGVLLSDSDNWTSLLWKVVPTVTDEKQRRLQVSAMEEYLKQFKQQENMDDYLTKDREALLKEAKQLKEKYF